MEEGVVLLRKKKKEKDEGPGIDKDAWMVTFSDLLQLLITFFVLLISMSSMDNQVLREMFVIFTGGVGELNRTGKARMLDPKIVPDVVPQTVDMDALKAILQIKAGTVQMDSRIEDFIGAVSVAKVETSAKAKEFSLFLSDAAHFEPGSIKMKPELLPVLSSLAEVLSLSKNHIRVEGHTDDTPSEGRILHTNWEYSAARASSVMKYFIEAGTLEPERIEAKGYASYHPLVKNISEPYRKRNRRVEIVIKQFEEEPF